jgi:hypothetical protein
LFAASLLCDSNTTACPVALHLTPPVNHCEPTEQFQLRPEYTGTTIGLCEPLRLNANVAPQLTAGGDGHAGGKILLLAPGSPTKNRFGAFEIAVLGPGAEAAAGARAARAPISIIW